jgi:hypothetical protein
MSKKAQAPSRRRIFLPVAAAAVLTVASGCSDNDACSGRKETCLSLSLTGAEGVDKVDQVQAFVSRMPKPLSPVDALGEPRALPFKVAILWPDGAASVHLRAFLQGKLIALTPEITLDLRNGVHERRKLTLFPPIVGTELPDMAGGTPPRDMATPRDLATPPADMATPEDMTTPVDMPQSDLPMPDMAPTLRAR